MPQPLSRAGSPYTQTQACPHPEKARTVLAVGVVEEASEMQMYHLPYSVVTGFSVFISLDFSATREIQRT